MRHTKEPNEFSFLVFSDDWGVHPSSCQHIFRHIGKKHRVLWVNTIGMRNPRLTTNDLKKARDKLIRMFQRKSNGGNSEQASNIVVCQPFMLPFSEIPMIRKWNKYSVIRTVKRFSSQMNINNPILVTTVPNACDYIGFLGERNVIYYCVDDFTEWPGLNKHLVNSMEQVLIQKSDIFIATSQKLFNKLRRYGKPTFVLTHGVDVDFFQNLPSEIHPLLAHIPEPRVGYLGLFDDRIDKDLLEAVASQLPNISFVVTGRIETDISRLRKLKNFYFTGPVSYEELPAILAGWNICMLPYKVNDLTNAIQPLKLKEYLATGREVVSTPIQETKMMSSMIHLAMTDKGWCQVISSLLNAKTNSDKEKIRKLLRDENWAHKASLFTDYINEILNAQLEGVNLHEKHDS